MATIFRLPRPEAGAERNITWWRHHGCPQAKALIPALDDPDIDLLLFPVGIIGYEMPLGIPFDVRTSDSCEACGAWVTAWFEWTGPSVFAPSFLWTPDVERGTVDVEGE